MSDDVSTLPAADAAPVADTAPPPAAGAPPPEPRAHPPAAASPEQDSWLSNVLGIDVAGYAGAATDALGNAVSAVADVGRDAVAGAQRIGAAVVDTAEQQAAAAAAVVGSVVATVQGAATAVVDGVKKALAGPPPIPRADLGPAQTARGDKLLKAMPPDDQAKVQATLDKATPSEKKYLQKALASSHSAAELEAFYKEIAGKDDAWMEQNLHVVGQSNGKGIKQQWSDSCAPTTVQAMRAELDPVYALKLRKESPRLTETDDDDATKLNPALAEEQRKMLEAHGGVAVARDATGGDGMATVDGLNEQSATTGLDFTATVITTANIDAALTEVDTAVASGLPVPLALGDDTGGHAVLVTGVDPGPPRRYSIHDPYNGEIVVVTDKQLKDGDFNIANWTRLKKVFKPTAQDPAP